ncbi:uncharacterized protein V1516DRAFT_663342 [Lipomyces oligophaga]|uniref:uncharacterized protein n=1 Tax=Lipomyces oligophaga TaxID=45792 RepID=UPI0034CEBDDA
MNRRTDSQLVRGRTVAMLVGCVLGLYAGIKLIPYELISWEPPSEEFKNKNPFIFRVRFEESKHLDLKPHIQDADYKEQVDKLATELRQQKREEALRLGLKYEEPKPKKSAQQLELERIKEQQAAQEKLRQSADMSTDLWMKSKFGDQEDEK